MRDIDTLKQQIRDRLLSINAEKIILFGSYAYGSPTEDSDLDLCIVKDNSISKIADKREVRKLLRDIDIPKDILVVDSEYFYSHSDENWINTALYDARERGVVLYG